MFRKGDFMKILLLVSLLSVSSFAFAKDYQVTGVVVDVSANKITVDKKGEKFEIATSAGVKTKGEVKKGSKVTVYYSMTATEIEVKAEGKAKNS